MSCDSINYERTFQNFIFFPKIALFTRFLQATPFFVSVLAKLYLSLKVANKLLGVSFKFNMISARHLQLRAVFLSIYDVICRHRIVSNTRVKLKWIYISTVLFHDGGCYHIETSQLIKQINGLVSIMTTASVMKELNGTKYSSVYWANFVEDSL